VSKEVVTKVLTNSIEHFNYSELNNISEDDKGNKVNIIIEAI